MVGGDPKDIAVIMFPIKTVGSNDYECSYQIRGVGQKPTSIFGATPIQAMQLALKMVCVELIGLSRSYHIVDVKTGVSISEDVLRPGVGPHPGDA